MIGQVMGNYVYSCQNCRISWHFLAWEGLFLGATMAALVQVIMKASLSALQRVVSRIMNQP